MTELKAPPPDWKEPVLLSEFRTQISDHEEGARVCRLQRMDSQAVALKSNAQILRGLHHYARLAVYQEQLRAEQAEEKLKKLSTIPPAGT